MEQALGSHPNLFKSGEHAALTDVILEISEITKIEQPYPDILNELTSEHIIKLRQVYWNSCSRRFGDDVFEKRYLDKLPLNIIELGLVEKIFPVSPVVVALRDPRDVCLSAFMQDFELNNAMVHFLSIDDAA